MKKITIAIDGYSSCGKSTLAKELAKELNYVFVDSGAMYRAVTLFVSQKKLVTPTSVNEEQIILSLPEINLDFKINPSTKSPEIFLNGENIESKIRTPFISSLVSKVASIKEVRIKLVDEQRKMGKNGGIIMDGRDIASVVFPNAELKLFITAEIPTRVERRYAEMISKGEKITKEEVQKNLLERDHLDSTRSESPLIQVDDAVVIDNTRLNKKEQLQLALDLVKART